jgi:two-component system CheB/CheR fusion protein
MNGYEVARALRQAPWGGAIWLAALTGYGRDRDLDLAHDAGFDAHLLKPVDLEKLEELLSRWTRPRDSEVQPGSQRVDPRGD